MLVTWAWAWLIGCCVFWLVVTSVLGKEFHLQPNGWGLKQRMMTSGAETVCTEEAAPVVSTTEYFCTADNSEDEEEGAAAAAPIELVEIAEEQEAETGGGRAETPAPEEAAPLTPPVTLRSSESASEALEEEEEEELTAEAKAERLEKALALKNEGNEKYKAGDLEEATKLYNEALNVCPTSENVTAAVIFSNLAHVLNARDKHEEALEAADAAIELDKTNGKGFLRKFQACKALAKPHECYQALKTALELIPDLRRQYGSQLAELKQQSDAKTEKDKEEMIGKLKEFGSWALGKVGMKLEDFKMVQDPATGSYNIQYNPSNASDQQSTTAPSE